MPKLYFIDTGLASSLLEIRSENQLSTHYLRGVLFENFIISEFIKERYNRGLRNNCYFWRDNKGIEIDCVIENGNNLTPVEIKSSNTFNQDFFKHLNWWNKLTDNSNNNSFVIYGGDLSRNMKEGALLSWQELSGVPLEA
jgi:predicted AAA+ superfamily ATPase